MKIQNAASPGRFIIINPPNLIWGRFNN